MKALSFAVVLIALAALAPGQAQAQVDQGDFRLFFDTGLMSYTMSRIKADAPAGDFKDKDNQLSIGPGLIGASTGVGVAYAASRHVLPGLYLGFNRTKLTGETEVDGRDADKNDRAFTQLELRPNLELAFLPEASFVPYGLIGLSYIYRGVSVEDDDDSDSSGIGPVLGLGAHAFAARNVSFDFSFTFRALFINDDDREDALEAAGLKDVKQREYAILFNLGASLWL